MKRTPLKRYTPLVAKTALKRTPLRKVSKRQRAREREWAEMKAQAIRERGDVCEPCLTHPDPRCSGRADDAHHMAGKLVQRLDVLLLVGRFHHDWIMNNSTLSYARGWSLKRNQQPSRHAPSPPLTEVGAST